MTEICEGCDGKCGARATQSAAGVRLCDYCAEVAWDALMLADGKLWANRLDLDKFVREVVKKLVPVQAKEQP
jgi:hypothetical protein